MQCFVCQKKNKESDKFINITPKGENSKVACRICGEYIHTTDADLILNGLSEPERHRLSGIIRERTLMKREPIILEYGTIEKLLKENPEKSVPEKFSYLLLNIAKLTKFAGASVVDTSDLHGHISYIVKV